MPFEIPDSWAWTTLGTTCNFERGITFPSSAKLYEESNENIACIRTANVQEALELSDLWYVDQCYMHNNLCKILRDGDIIMSSANSRELVGKTAVYKETMGRMTFGGFVIVIRGVLINIDYLHITLKWNFLSGKFAVMASQTTNIANLNSSIISGVRLSLPPIQEQNRIATLVLNFFSVLKIIEKNLL